MKIVPVKEIPAETTIPDDPLEILKVCTQMGSLCRKLKGVGLSAVQVGIPWKVCVIWPQDWEKAKYLVGCEYTPQDKEKEKSFEGCLSLPNRLFIVERYKAVIVAGKELVATHGEPKLVDFKQEYSNYVGVVCQHEIDHHNNILISDIGVEVVPDASMSNSLK